MGRTVKIAVTIQEETHSGGSSNFSEASEAYGTLDRQDWKIIIDPRTRKCVWLYTGSCGSGSNLQGRLPDNWKRKEVNICTAYLAGESSLTIVCPCIRSVKISYIAVKKMQRWSRHTTNGIRLWLFFDVEDSAARISVMGGGVKREQSYKTGTPPRKWEKRRCLFSIYDHWRSRRSCSFPWWLWGGWSCDFMFRKGVESTRRPLIPRLGIWGNFHSSGVET